MLGAEQAGGRAVVEAAIALVCVGRLILTAAEAAPYAARIADAEVDMSQFGSPVRELFWAMIVSIWLVPGFTAEPDPVVMNYQLPDTIEWSEGRGASQAVLVGDPSKPGIYVVLTKWHPGNMSRPHFHPNDRYITVLSGTWWVGWGDTFDPDSTFPIPAGSFVTHFGNQIHYDGAKDEEVVLQIVGMGPATGTSAERP